MIGIGGTELELVDGDRFTSRFFMDGDRDGGALRAVVSEPDALARPWRQCLENGGHRCPTRLERLLLKDPAEPLRSLESAEAKTSSPATKLLNFDGALDGSTYPKGARHG